MKKKLSKKEQEQIEIFLHDIHKCTIHENCTNCKNINECLNKLESIPQNKILSSLFKLFRKDITGTKKELIEYAEKIKKKKKQNNLK